MKLTLQFIPFSEIEPLSSYKRIIKLLNMIGDDRILLLQGRLKPEEEADLIEETMKKIGKSKKFKGIELAVFSPKSVNLPVMMLIRKKLADFLVGGQDNLTVIGPASIIREIKKDPTKMQLLLKK
jgi:hypothetical protein